MRINMAYVIATSTRVDMTGVTVDAKIDDAMLRKEKKIKNKKAEDKFFEGKPKKVEIPAIRKEMQVAVDSQLLPKINAVPMLKNYLHSGFSLIEGQYPHNMKF